METIQIFSTYLYGEKLHFYERTAKVGRLQYPSCLLSVTYALNPVRLKLLASYIAMYKAMNVLVPRQLTEAF